MKEKRGASKCVHISCVVARHEHFLLIPLHGHASRPSLIPRFLGRQGQSPCLPLSIVQTHTCVGLITINLGEAGSACDRGGGLSGEASQEEEGGESSSPSFHTY